MIFNGKDDVEKVLLDEIDKNLMMKHDQEIASVIRLSGTKEEAQSFAYVQSQLENFGIKTELFYSDGYISLPGKAEMTANGQPITCITHSMAVATAGTEGELIYAGKGMAENYNGLDAAGKVVLINGLAMGPLVKEAQDRGAVALICINAEYTHEMITSRVWGSPTPETIDLLPKIPIVSVNIPNGEKLKSMLQDGAVIVKMQTEVDTQWRKIPTLVGTITGNEQPDKFLLLSNHIDGWHYGAMDNGSANAAMLEVVRILCKHQDKLKRSVRIAFWSGHSHGRYAGSTWYCDTFFEDLYENCFLHVNADSLGAKGSCILTQANAMAETKGLAYDVIKELTGQLFEGARYGRAGDQSFWGTGTPSLYMGLSEQELKPGLAAEAFASLFGSGKTGGFGWWWHTTQDTVDKIDPECLARDCAVYLLSVYRACADEYIPVDQSAAVDEIEQILHGYATVSAGKVDMSLTLARIDELKKLVAAAYANKSAYSPAAFNRYIMDMSQVLIPLNYVRGNIYEHDLAVRQKDVPLLTELTKMADIDLDSDDYKSMMVLVRRKLNQVNHALLKAIRITAAL